MAILFESPPLKNKMITPGSNMFLYERRNTFIPIRYEPMHYCLKTCTRNSQKCDGSKMVKVFFANLCGTFFIFK